MDNDKRVILLKQGDIPKLVMKMSAPAIVAMLVMSIYNLVDALFMGMLGTEALGAATVGYPYFTLLTSLGLMFGMGGASYKSRLLGEQKTDLAEKALATVIISCTAFGFIVSLITAPMSGSIATIFGANEMLYNASTDYIAVLSIGAVFPILSICLNNLLRAEGSAMQSLIGMGLGALLNIALDPLFMFTFSMGVKGAAFATIVSQAISAAILLSFYVRKKTLVTLRIRQFCLDLKIYMEVLKVGGAAFMQQLLITVTMAVINIIAVNLGGDSLGGAYIAAVGIVNRFSLMGYAVMTGFGQGLQPVIGYNYGAKQYLRVKQAIRFAFIITTVFGIVMAVISLAFAPVISKLFSKNVDVITPATMGIRYLWVSWPFAGLFFVIQVLYQALGRAKQAIALASVRQIFMVTCAFILPPLYGIEGLMSIRTISMLLSTAIAVLLYWPYRKELANLIESSTASLKSTGKLS